MFEFTHNNIDKLINYKPINLNTKHNKIFLDQYFFMKKLRMLEQEISRQYHKKNRMRCPVHLCIGQEAGPAALSTLIKKNDYLFSHHRSHGYYLAKRAPMNKLVAELYGKKTGSNGGFAGSQDISFAQKNFYAGAILAGTIGIAIGAARAIQKNNDKSVVFCTFGESATDQGVFWESINIASLYKLPIIFICENNNYSVFSPQSKRSLKDNLIDKTTSFIENSKREFGNDVYAVYNTLSKMIKDIKLHKGPCFLELITYRISAHYGPGDDSKFYRSKEEMKSWKRLCPIKLAEITLKKHKLIDSQLIKSEEKLMMNEIKNSFQFAEKSNFPKTNNWEIFNYSKRLSDQKILSSKKFNLPIKIDKKLIKGY